MNSAVMQQKKITFPMITFHQYHGSGSNFGLKIHIHTDLNYTGRLRIKYMVQQRTLCKVFEDDHYFQPFINMLENWLFDIQTLHHL